MKSKFFIILSLFLFVGCIDESKRMEFLKEKYPEYKIEPATSILKSSGIEYILVDTLSDHIYGVSFWGFSETRISNFRNIR